MPADPKARRPAPAWLRRALTRLLVGGSLAALVTHLVLVWQIQLRATETGARPNPAWTGMPALERLDILVTGLLVILLLAGVLVALKLNQRFKRALTDAERRTIELGAAREARAQSLRDSRELFTSSNDLLFSVDPEGWFQVVNPRFEEVLGYSQEAAPSHRLPDLLRPDFRPLWDELLRAAHQGERIPYVDAVLLARDGSEIAVVGACWPRFADGRFVELRGVLVDVTAQRQAQEELVLGEERFRNLFERTPYPLLVYDCETLLLREVNATTLSCYGYTRDEMLTRRICDLHPEDEVPRLLEHLSRPRRPQEQEGLWRHRLRDGRIIDVEIVSNAIDFAGRDARLVFARDVTAHLATQEALRDSEGRYRALFENSPGLLCSHDLTGKILAVNPAAARQLGCEPGEMIGQKLQDYLAASVTGLFELYLEAMLAEGSASGLMRVVSRQGEERVWMYSNALFEKAGAPAYVLGHAVDITDRLRAERELEASERRYRELFESSGDLIQSVDQRGYFQYTNPMWQKTLGYSEEELPGLHFTDVIAPSELNHCLEVFSRLAEGQTISKVETIFLTKNGERKVMVEGSISPSFVDGHFIGTRGFFRDVTERRRLEAEKQMYLDRIEHQNLDLELRNREVERANRLKSEFLATMSHELRTPLNAIIGFSDLLAEEEVGPLNDPQRSYLGFVRKGSRHLLRLINDVLDLAKIEAGKIDLDLETFRPAETVGEVLATLEPLLHGKQIRCDSRIPDDLEIHADRVRIKQVLFNLLSNAIKFTPVGGQVTLSAGQAEEEIVFAVRDTGCGIAAEEQEAIFSEFHQVATSASRAREGTGLGLSIVKRLIDLHRGRIWVESQPGQGSTFSFALPLHRGEEPGLPHAAASPPAPRLHPLALVVDEDPAAQELVGSHLRSAGYEPVFASSRTEALSKARSLKPDLVTLELAVDREGGWRILEELKRSSDTSPIPVIVVSVVDEKRRALALGAAGCLVKPVSRDELAAVARRFAPPVRAIPDTVLIVDDQAETNLRLSDAVLAAGFRPLAAKNGREALQILADARPGALLINLDLPEMDGFQTIVRLRADPVFRELPILALAPDDTKLADLALLAGNTRLVYQLDVPWKERIAEELSGLLSLPQEVS